MSNDLQIFSELIDNFKEFINNLESPSKNAINMLLNMNGESTKINPFIGVHNYLLKSVCIFIKNKWSEKACDILGEYVYNYNFGEVPMKLNLTYSDNSTKDILIQSNEDLYNFFENTYKEN